ncbi:MAG TPA: MerR family transcriptional regulator [Symbiobacteriaceae bacterium]|nr:MerR family transcriptional regulator [Symbiobacteriaceae bacterium]
MVEPQGDARKKLMLSITQVADRTGLSPSALRFYERKGILVPAERLPNGYRNYAPEQVKEAQLINSLRQTGASIAAIREFLAQDALGRQHLLAQWRSEVAARLLSIQMADQYLQALRPDAPQIHLQRWEEPSALLWFPAAAPPQPLPFTPAIERHGRQLERLGNKVLSGGYVRTLDLAGGQLTGEVGFRVAPGLRRVPDGARVEPVDPVLFVTLECGIEDDQSAHRIWRFIHDFGFVPSGRTLERYLLGLPDVYQIMVAVDRA